MKRLLHIAIGLVVVVVVMIVLAISSVNDFLDEPANIPEGGTTYEVVAGRAFTHVSNDLASKGIVSQPDWFRWYAQYQGKASQIKAGEYRLQAGDTPRVILERFVAGKVAHYSFTIVEGWNYRELAVALESSDVIQMTMSYEDWPALLESWGAETAYPEGLFLPETYQVPRNTSDVEVLRQAYELMQTALAEEWADRDESLPIATPYEALILASIIEKETARTDERPTISGVFVRRLQTRMRLQTDPTVIYGIGEDYDGNITRKHLRTDTPYNTYTRHGLPPTPIAMPGRAAINAALHPSAGKELYFVATGLGDGSHKFSETKAEHDAAVQAYLRRQRAGKTGKDGT
jgi:UPF0755 protein